MGQNDSQVAEIAAHVVVRFLCHGVAGPAACVIEQEYSAVVGESAHEALKMRLGLEKSRKAEQHVSCGFRTDVLPPQPTRAFCSDNKKPKVLLAHLRRCHGGT